MKANIWIRDIICQVLVDYKSIDLIYSILNKFISGYANLNLDYVSTPNNEYLNQQMIEWHLVLPLMELDKLNAYIFLN